MYAFLHVALFKYIERLENSECLIAQISAMVGEELNPNGNIYKSFSDEETLQLVRAAATVTQTTVNDVLCGMGSVQLESFEEKGYMPLIDALGQDLWEFLEHIDALHQNLVQSYPNMTAPSFRPEMMDDGTVMLHYYSSRPGLWPYAVTLITALARDHFRRPINMEHIQKRHEGHEHDIFIVTTQDGLPLRLNRAATHDASELSRCTLSLTDADKLFPWHICFDKTMRVTSLGSDIKQCFPFLEEENPMLTSLVKLVRPSILKLDFEGLKRFNNTSFLLIVRDDTYVDIRRRKREEKRTGKQAGKQAGKQGKQLGKGAAAGACPLGHGAPKAPSDDAEDDEEENSAEFEAEALREFQRKSSCSSLEAEQFISETADYLYLKGEIVFLEDGTALLAGVPQISRPEDLHSRNLSLKNLPVHSNARELLFSSMHQSATIGIAMQLESTMESLAKTRREMERERARSEQLLHAILPRTVAKNLAEGKKTPAERYPSASVLFSDIVGFTRISSSVRPTQVMDMLNELFSRFDALCEKHNVYKVETIGDCFMAVAGLPVPDERHPVMLADFALDMIEAAKEVTSPVDGSPLRIRIGMHSGSIMAGVVGTTRPRYCLFGDTVNVASRMESTSVPGAIQMSASLMSELHARGATYKTRSRGDVEIKGKGSMQTFFLVGKDAIIDDLVPSDEVMVEANKKLAPAAAAPASGAPQNGPSVPMQSIMMAQAAPAPAVTYVDVLIRVGQDATRLAGVASTTSLGALLDSALSAAVAENWRLFADESRLEMLVPAQTVGNVMDAAVAETQLVRNKRTQRTTRQMVLYAKPLRLNAAEV